MMKIIVLMSYSSPRIIRENHEVLPHTPTIREQLDALRKEIEHEQNREKRRLIERHISRLEAFDTLMHHPTHPDDTASHAIRTILMGHTPETYTNSDLLSLKKQ